MSQNYGVLRIVRVHPYVSKQGKRHDKSLTGWLPEERPLYVLSCRETSIGRALNNDLVLLDPSVSREHARLVFNEHGWYVFNMTEYNAVHVNGLVVANGGCLPIRPQDFLVIGNTLLQLVAPRLRDAEAVSTDAPELCEQSQAMSSARASRDAQPQGLAHEGVPANASHPQTTHIVDNASIPLHPPTIDVSSLDQSEPEDVGLIWHDPPENVFGERGTTQFALSRHLQGRVRWFILATGVGILLISAAITLVLNSMAGITALASSNASNILLALTIPFLPALGINLLVNFIDRFEREPWYLRLMAFLWGAIIAIPTASLIEENINYSILSMPGSDYLLRSIYKGLNAGITEETIKGFGLLLLFLVLRDEFDNITDGIVYGALIGAGFAMVENFYYFTVYPKDFLLSLIVGRIMLGWLCHSTFTVCFGAALGYVRHTQVRWRQIVIPLLGYLGAVGLHSLFDFVSFFVNELLLAYPGNTTVSTLALVAIISDYIPPFIAQIFLLYLLIRSLGHEGAIIREYLTSEVYDGVVSVEEYVLLQNSFQRTKRERNVLRQKGVRQWLRVKTLYQTQIGLAFRKWHVSMGDKPKLGYLQPEDAYRQRITHLRQEIAQAQTSRALDSSIASSA